MIAEAKPKTLLEQMQGLCDAEIGNGQAARPGSVTWNDKQYVMATQGHGLLLIESDEDIPMHPLARPAKLMLEEVSKLPLKPIEQYTFRYWLYHSPAGRVKCEDCKGKGRRYGAICPECEGTKEVEPYSDKGVIQDGETATVIDRILLRRFLAPVNGEQSIAIRKAQFCVIKGTDWILLIMPMNQDRIAPAEIAKAPRFFV